MAAKRSVFAHAQPEDSAGFLLWQVSNSWQASIRRALQNIGLTHVQFVLLAVLRFSQENQLKVTQRDLARRARVDAMVASKVLRQLEALGLARRPLDASDARARMPQITASGLRLLRRAVPLVNAADDAFFRPLGRDEARFRELLSQLSEPD
ncbi:MAG: MarR family transcriptional regulator [Leptospirales bacterium]|nr:MarR family transcriptional regulator [Leptospirales bacterium]